ncbi:MAG TPA: class I SAM-dependent methyltransferase [Candidatus Krumholzibacteria bacterium]
MNLSVLLLALNLAAATPPADTAYVNQPPSRDGTGKVYMGREIAIPMGHRGATWLERRSREHEESPATLVRMLQLRPTDVVADIGAGTGYFSFRIAPLVPQGSVLAVDIEPEMLDDIRAKMKRTRVENIVPVQGAIDDPGLPADSVDVALMVDAYHEFSHPREMMRAILGALRPGGRVVLVEYRAEDTDVPIKPLHKMTEAQARREMEAAGLRWLRTANDLPWQHFMVFEKPASRSP